jgi:enterochelin esterase-like enzyme
MWRRRFTLWFCLLLVHGTRMSQGRILPELQVESRALEARRTVRVYLPPSYETAPRRRYPVLYVHDGQNVFSTAGRDCCFGWGSWELDRTVDALCAAGRVQEIIIVAIDHGRARYQEYRGPIASSGAPRTKPSPAQGANASNVNRYEAYARFLIEELKPRIDREYRTKRTAAHTGVLGASLGGICSLALAWDYPKVFGLAACLSSSFQIERTNFLKNVLGSYRGRPKPVRIYLDSGTMDFTGDDDGRALTEQVALELRRIGWKDAKNLRHFVQSQFASEEEMASDGLRRDKWAEAKRSHHNEFYWRSRVWRALTFLFPPGR